MLNLPLRPQVLFLSLLPPHLLVCRAEQALGSRRLCLLLQTAAEAPGTREPGWGSGLHGAGSTSTCFPWLLKTSSGAQRPCGNLSLPSAGCSSRLCVHSGGAVLGLSWSCCCLRCSLLAIFSLV